MDDEIVPMSSLGFWYMLYYNRALEIRWAIAEGRLWPEPEGMDEESYQV